MFNLQRDKKIELINIKLLFMLLIATIVISNAYLIKMQFICIKKIIDFKYYNFSFRIKLLYCKLKINISVL